MSILDDLAIETRNLLDAFNDVSAVGEIADGLAGEVA